MQADVTEVVDAVNGVTVAVRELVSQGVEQLAASQQTVVSMMVLVGVVLACTAIMVLAVMLKW